MNVLLKKLSDNAPVLFEIYFSYSFTFKRIKIIGYYVLTKWSNIEISNHNRDI